MNKMIFISPQVLYGINAVSELGNSDTFLKYLDPIDYHFLLFSTLYQSGTDLFQLDINNLPESIRTNVFWKDKFVDIDKKIFNKSLKKANNILLQNFDRELDNKYHAPQFHNIENYLSNLFYSAETGNPFINAEFAESKSFDFLESRFSKELFLAIKNFNSIVQSDEISTITPQYSVLKKDLKRFEDIANSTIYLKYSDSLNLLPLETKIETVKKEIHSNALKVYNKYSKNLDLSAMTFNFLKFNKKIADLFISKPTSIVGDYLIESFENIATRKRKVYYYKVKEAHYMIQWANRIGELMNKGGKDKLEELINNFK